MPVQTMQEHIERGDPCPSCAAPWERLAPLEYKLTHKAGCAYDLYVRLEVFDEVDYPGEDPDDAYVRWCFDSNAEMGTFLPMPIDRLSPANVCDMCGQAPDAEHPATYYAGLPADLENGPSPNDIPYTLHDGECPPPGPLVEIVYCPQCGSLDRCEHDEGRA
jgi:hypothetical protein